MKHRLQGLFLALLLGLCLPASAQSNVTLYGLLDAAMDYSSQGAGRLVRLQSGGTYGSRWGLKGSEDLGDGLKAIFQLESGFGIDNGTLQQGGRIFGRHSWVGLDSPLGTLTAGRQLSPEYFAFVYNDAFELGNAAGLSVITKTNAAGVPAFLLNSYVVTGRIDNSLNYATPSFGGVTGRFMVGLGETAIGLKAGSTYSGGVRYLGGPFDLNAGYISNKDTDGFGFFKAWSVGGSYAIGNAKVFLAYTDDFDSSRDTAAAKPPKSEFALINLGIRYKTTPFLTAIAQVIRVKDKSENIPGNRDETVLGIGFNYDLSKRTALYGSAGTVGNRNGSKYSLGGALYAGGPVTGDARAKTFTLGVRHLF